MKAVSSSRNRKSVLLIAGLLPALFVLRDAAAKSGTPPSPIFCKGVHQHFVPELEIGIFNTGQVEWNGKVITKADFRKRLKTEAARGQSRPDIRVAAMPDTLYGQITPVLAEIEGAGFQNVCLLGTN